MTPANKVKVVILGSNPSPRKNVGDGLAFSVFANVKAIGNPTLPLLKEYCSDLGYPFPHTGSLRSWAREGVLLLNTCLTCEYQKPRKHDKLGWYKLVIEVVNRLQRERTGLVFILIGKHAAEYEGLIDKNKHLVIRTGFPGRKKNKKEPSFKGSKIFSKTNAFLGKENAINWRLQ